MSSLGALAGPLWRSGMNGLQGELGVTRASSFRPLAPFLSALPEHARQPASPCAPPWPVCDKLSFAGSALLTHATAEWDLLCLPNRRVESCRLTWSFSPGFGDDNYVTSRPNHLPFALAILNISSPKTSEHLVGCSRSPGCSLLLFTPSPHPHPPTSNDTPHTPPQSSCRSL